jgi:hypothetical protein
VGSADYPITVYGAGNPIAVWVGLSAVCGSDNPRHCARRGQPHHRVRIRPFGRFQHGQPRYRVRRGHSRVWRGQPSTVRGVGPITVCDTGINYRRTLIRDGGARFCISIPQNLPCAAAISLWFGDLSRSISIPENFLK